jgi:hypothetical protein
MKFNFSRFSLGKKGEEPRTKNESFSEFFLNASEKEKEAVITKAAKQANEEQRKVFDESRVALKR